jgi:hypothetical protein
MVGSGPNKGYEQTLTLLPLLTILHKSPPGVSGTVSQAAFGEFGVTLTSSLKGYQEQRMVRI